METENYKFRNKRSLSGILAMPGFVLMAVPVLFSEREMWVCICSLAGYFTFLIAERTGHQRKEFVFTVILFVLAFIIRYSVSFGTKPGYLAISCVASLLIGLLNSSVLLLDHLLIRHDRRSLAILSVPAVYVLVQYLLLIIGLGNFYDPLGYALIIPVYSMNLSQIGEYGLSFVTALALSLIADSVSRNKNHRNMTGLILGLVLAAVLTITGDLLLNTEKEPDAVLHVAVALPFENDMDGSLSVNHSAEEWQDLFDRSVKTAAENQADLLVLTEEFYVVRRSREEEVMRDVAETVRTNGIPVLACFEVWGEGEERSVNKAVLFDGDGNICMEYVKNNLIPYLESAAFVDGPEEPGTCTTQLGGKEVKIATVICFDQNDADYIHKIPAETELLLVPAWEWDTVNLDQRRMRMRSVELNTTVLKHAFEGFTYASGPWGLYGEMQDNRGVCETVRMIDVPVWEK